MLFSASAYSNKRLYDDNVYIIYYKVELVVVYKFRYIFFLGGFWL